MVKTREFRAIWQLFVPRRIPFERERGVFVFKDRTLFNLTKNQRLDGYGLPGGNEFLKRELKNGAWVQLVVTSFYPERVRVFFTKEGKLLVLRPYRVEEREKNGERKKLYRWVCAKARFLNPKKAYVASLAKKRIEIRKFWVGWKEGLPIFRSELIFNSYLADELEFPEEIKGFNLKVFEEKMEREEREKKEE